MSDARHELGLRGERLAEKHLRRAGCKTLARRFSTPVGEIDLVMADGETIVFVEVKTQRDRAFQDPELRVTPAKQRKLIRAARWYLHHRRLDDVPCRFDVVAVVLPPGGPAEVTHFADAFVPGRW